MVTRDSPECRAFQQCFDDLVVTFTSNVSGITTQLFSKELIGKAAVERAHTIGLPNNEKVVPILHCIQTSIGREPEKFGTFLCVLRENGELCDLANKLEECRDKIRAEASRHVSTMRSASASVVPSSPPVQLLRALGERSFPSLAGSTPSARIPTVVRPVDLPIENRKKHSNASTTPSPASSITRPVPCTDGNEKDTDARLSTATMEHTSLLKEVAERKCDIKKLEDALGALRIEGDRKLSERDLTVHVLSLTVQDLHTERDRLVLEIEDWRAYVQSLMQDIEMLKQERTLLEEKVAFFEDDRESFKLEHTMELDRLKQQVQAEVKEKMELLAQLEAHHRTAFQKGAERRAKSEGTRRRHSHSL